MMRRQVLAIRWAWPNAQQSIVEDDRRVRVPNHQSRKTMGGASIDVPLTVLQGPYLPDAKTCEQVQHLQSTQNTRARRNNCCNL